MNNLVLDFRGSRVYSFEVQESLNFLSVKGKTVLITGASSGIGTACAEGLAQNGARLILNSRRVPKLDFLSSRLKSSFGADCFVLPFDVRDYEAARAALDSLPSGWGDIEILINNAGVGKGWSKMSEGNAIDWDETIDCNVKGVMYLTRLVLPGMLARGSGHIVNVASISGIETYANDAVYIASKAAVRAMSEALKKDMLGTPIRVTIVSPGMVRTEFATVRAYGKEEAAAKAYSGYRPLEPSDVADTILFAVTRPGHVNLNEIVMMSVDQASPSLMNIRESE